jgi:hypothetical protein
MLNPVPLKKGQEVLLKRPRYIYAEVLNPSEGDFGSPAMPESYVVRLLPLEQHYLPEDLELAEPPQTKRGRLERMSLEWVKELARCNEVARRWVINQGDASLSKELSESMVKLGFAV